MFEKKTAYKLIKPPKLQQNFQKNIQPLNKKLLGCVSYIMRITTRKATFIMIN